MVRLINYWNGYVRIKVWGGSVERFVNLCGNKDLLIWGISKKGDTYEMYISLQAFYELRTIARKTLTRVVILKRYGLPFLLPGLRKRIVFTTCAVMVIFLLYASSKFLWDIEYDGNMRLTDEVIGDFLEDQGVNIGMYTGKLDIEVLEKAIRRHFPEVTWVSMKLDGSRLMVSLKENDAPIIEDSAKNHITVGLDMVSEYEGEIVSIIVRKGIPQVSAGDMVKKGTILVTGKVPVLNEDTTIKEYLYVEADADIELKHVLDYREKLPFFYSEKTYTGREKNGYFLRFNEEEIAFKEPGKYFVYDVVTKTYQSKLFEKLNIPFFIGRIIYREYYNIEKKYSIEQAEAKLNDKLEQFINSLERKGVQIIEKDVKISINEEGWINSGSITVIESIAVKYPTLIENKDSGE